MPLLPQDEFFMREAFALAHRAFEQGEVPVGAVLVDADLKTIGSGHNQMIATHDPTAHAEICALRMAGRYLKNYRIPKTTLYVTLEPCPMCAGALLAARVQRVVFAARDFKTGAAGSVCNLFHQGKFNHSIQVDEGILAEESSALLLHFFKSKREV